MNAFISSTLTWATNNLFSLIATFVVCIVYVIVLRYVRPRLEQGVERSQLQGNALQKAKGSIVLIIATLSVVVLLFIWGIDFSGILVLSTGLLTLTGVALFASWSMLSNITAFFILLIHQSFRRGNFIRIIEMDNYVEGYISEINLFSTKLISEQREIINYPNNLLISRPVIINPRAHFQTVGKTTDLLPALLDSEASPPSASSTQRLP
ncbi:MAG: mechanosensitive ion channel domain-containing protein [Pseudohongiellaceae bacterium]